MLKITLRCHKKKKKNLLDLINSCGKVAGYKINIQKSVAFPYTNIKQPEKEIRKIILFMITSKKKKKQVINLRGEHNENYKTLKKEIEEDIRKWKDLQFG
jgi:hypothetical protein